MLFYTQLRKVALMDLHHYIKIHGLTSLSRRTGKAVSTIQRWANSEKKYKLIAVDSGFEVWEKK